MKGCSTRYIVQIIPLIPIQKKNIKNGRTQCKNDQKQPKNIEIVIEKKSKNIENGQNSFEKTVVNG